MNNNREDTSWLRRRLSRLGQRISIYAFYGVLKLIPEKEVLELFIHRFGIVELSVKGEQGIFGGSASLEYIIRRYALERTWSAVFLKRCVDYLDQHSDLTYLDIGANIGLTSVPVAAAGHRVIAFEPVPENFRHLSENVRRNGAESRMTVHNTAILEKKGTVVFELSPFNHGDHRYRKDAEIAGMGENDWLTVEVAGEALDDLVGEVSGNFVVKMDTQGSEPLVVQGGQQVLNRAKMILCEFSPYQMRRMGTDAAILIDFLAGFDRVEIYICEENEIDRCFSDGAALARYLSDYHRDWQLEPAGRYLNILATRD